jgi:hypothetical protein
MTEQRTEGHEALLTNIDSQAYEWYCTEDCSMLTCASGLIMGLMNALHLKIWPPLPANNSIGALMRAFLECDKILVPCSITRTHHSNEYIGAEEIEAACKDVSKSLPGLCLKCIKADSRGECEHVAMLNDWESKDVGWRRG